MIKRWDGCNNAGVQIISDEEIEQWNMTVDDETGTVYYINGEGKELIWCPGSMLNAHLRHLEQVFARR